MIFASSHNHSICLRSDADLCCPCLPVKKLNKIICCYLKPNGLCAAVAAPLCLCRVRLVTLGAPLSAQGAQGARLQLDLEGQSSLRASLASALPCPVSACGSTVPQAHSRNKDSTELKKMDNMAQSQQSLTFGGVTIYRFRTF
ncbi:hypothetical protein DV515_00001509 [Chloebia gouldiae]|uniref:Uncharacterized protein n=1 Tax=Chloebia gouldiae TaxID=44316 RepID=A0A3L8T3Z9_CHLGU|nr:hypothetical protein DV515_00001509 [Chloebia gouldiae]